MPRIVTPDFSYLQRNLNDKTEIVYDGQPLCNPFVTEYGYTVYTCFLTVEDYKELVKCSEQTARRTFAQKDFPSFNFGKTLLVEIHALVEYMQQAHSRKDALSFAPNVIDARYRFERTRKRVFDKLCELMASSSGKTINACFLTVNDVMALTGLGRTTVYTLFNRTDFPTTHMARKMVVEIHAFVDFFSKPHKQNQEAA